MRTMRTTMTKHAISAFTLLAIPATDVLAGGLVGDPELIVAGRTTRVTAEHLDGDGYVDLAVGNGIDTVTTLLNDGAGGFTVVSSVGAARPDDVVLADLDLNTSMELVVLESDPPATRVYALSNGVIGAVTSYGAPPFTTTVAVTDASGGPAPELVVTGELDITVRVNAGDGTFANSFPWDAGICRFDIVVPADLDNDGDEDLIVSGGASLFDLTNCGAIRIIERTSSGIVNHVTYIEDFDHQATNVGDVDDDGDLDIMTVANGPFLIRAAVLVNDGTGIFSNGWFVDVFDIPPSKLDLLDIDGDGDLDAITGLDLWINEDGAGDFGSGSVDLLQGAAWPYGGVFDHTVVDVDNDGDRDIVIAALNGLVVLRSFAACVADFSDSGGVGFDDLSQLLNAWGACGACPEDLNGDGQVGFADLSALLNSWGPC